MHFFVPRTIFGLKGVALLCGLVLVAAGVALGVWSMVAVRDNDLAWPSELSVRGPYAFSRNPMYVGWIIICAGIALVVNSAGLALATVAAWIYLHTVTIPSEEGFLLRRFGAEYEAYRRQVRRYL